MVPDDRLHLPLHGSRAHEQRVLVHDVHEGLRVEVVKVVVGQQDEARVVGLVGDLERVHVIDFAVPFKTDTALGVHGDAV